MFLPSFRKYAQVVRPLPVETSFGSDPSAFMMKIWSHSYPGRVDWNMSRFPSGAQYASAFCPPCVSCLIFPRCCACAESRSALRKSRKGSFI